MVPSPRCNSWSPLAGLGLDDPTHLKAAGMEIGPSQGLLLRPFMPSNFKSLALRDLTDAKERNIIQTWEEGEFKEGLEEENDCVDMQRYGDNIYEQSPSPFFFFFFFFFSVFGQPCSQGVLQTCGVLRSMRI